MCLMLSFNFGLVLPAKMSKGEGFKSQRWNGVDSINRMEYIKYENDCGNFLDPCGGKDDLPCCPPDFCLQGMCQNNTLT